MQWWSHPDESVARNDSLAAESDVTVVHRGPAVRVYPRSGDVSAAPSLSLPSVVVGQEIELVTTVIVPEGTVQGAQVTVSLSNTDVLDAGSMELVSVRGPSSGFLRVQCGADPEADVSALGLAGNFAVDSLTGRVTLGPCVLVNNDTDNAVQEPLEVVVRGVVSSNASVSVRGASVTVSSSIESADIVPA